MRFLLAALFMSAPLYGQFCDFALSTTSVNFPAAAGTGQVSVTVTGPSGCGWSATSNANWLHITSGAGYIGSQTVTFSVDANTSGFARAATLSVAGKTVTIMQAAANCAFAVNPVSQNFPVIGGAFSFAVTANCSWQAGPNANFITLKNAAGGTGNDTVTFAVAPNPCVAGRSGSVTVNTGLPNPPVFTVTQEGSPSNLTISAAGTSVGPGASDGRVLVNTGEGCSWSSSSDTSWLQITGGFSGAGNGAVAYHVLANTSSARSGSIHVGNLTFTVTQAAAGLATPVLKGLGSAASYATDAVSPGEIVVLTGTGMGPAALVTLQLNNGAVANVLAGTQVAFDGVAAPIVYARQDQVSAVVPYGITNKTTQVAVVFNGVPSSPVTMPVQPAHPAIFTLDTSGNGPGAILNQDGSVNAQVNPAPRGSVVWIFATGGGTTNPALPDGAITGTPLPRLTQDVSVSIGGLDARVTYAGGAPGALAGLTQINAEVPAGVTPGPSVPVVLRIGGFTSSGNATVAVK
jgi:uncharacterized protein (TIGR03437 family)